MSNFCISLEQNHTRIQHNCNRGRCEESISVREQCTNNSKDAIILLSTAFITAITVMCVIIVLLFHYPKEQFTRIKMLHIKM